MTLVAFDLDGTLFDVGPEVNYEDRESMRTHTRPHEAAIRRLQRLYMDGARVAYITGRCDHLRGFTLVQLARAGAPPGALYMQRTWSGYDVMAKYKADALRACGAILYVGDHDSDRRAAERARIAFMLADDWRRGDALPLDLFPVTPPEGSPPSLPEPTTVPPSGA